jgi:hypothetical protein
MIHKNDEIKRRFYQVDKLLLENPKYKELSDGAVLTWSILRDRMELSKLNSEVYSDEEGYLFLIFTDEELAEVIHRTRKTANSRKKELEMFGLLHSVRMGNQEPNRIYLLEPETCDPSEYISETYRQKKKEELAEKHSTKAKLQKEKYIENGVESLGGVVKSKKGTSGRVKKVHPDVQNLPTNDTEDFKTDLKELNKVIDDDKPTSPEGEDSPKQINENIKLLISNFRDATKTDMTARTFNAVVRKVLDKYEQGKVSSFRDYLATALTKKIEEMDLRNQTYAAMRELREDKIKKTEDRLNNLKVSDNIPFYNWLEED